MRADQATEPDIRAVPRVFSDLAEGHLTATETGAVVAWMVAAGLDPAPSWIVNRAVRIADQGRARQAPCRARWRRLVAVPVYDTRLRRRLAGARSVDLDRPRLLYEADLVEIDLEVGESTLAGRVRLLGHVAAAECDVAHAWVTIDGPSGHREAAADALGQFSLEGLVPGVHRMEIGLATELIEIPELRL
jgi:hypothetical protein